MSYEKDLKFFSEHNLASLGASEKESKRCMGKSFHSDNDPKPKIPYEGAGFEKDKKKKPEEDEESKRSMGFGGGGFKKPFNSGGGGFKKPFNSGGGGFKKPFNSGGGGFKKPFNSGGGGFKKPFNSGGGGFKRHMGMDDEEGMDRNMSFGEDKGKKFMGSMDEKMKAIKAHEKKEIKDDKKMLKKLK